MSQLLSFLFSIAKKSAQPDVQYYAAFTFDLTILAKCTVVPVYSSNPSIGPTPDELENAAASAEARGLRVRVLLLTNPNNPLGTIYPPGIIKSSINWARNRMIHTIVDEIYALSAQESEFESVLKILHGDLRNDVRDDGALCNDYKQTTLTLFYHFHFPLGASYICVEQRLLCKRFSNWHSLHQK
jgi:histidinol-phosphate/aromatic aminotransferase/cobyric acid decarboxylase-like protein